MLTFAREMEILTAAVAHHTVDREQESKKARRTSRSYRLFADNQERIFEYLQDQPPLTVNAIGQAVGLKRSTVYQHLQQLIALGRVRRIEASPNRHMFVLLEEAKQAHEREYFERQGK